MSKRSPTLKTGFYKKGPSLNKIFDTVIIGAGPIGLSCGIACKKAGLRYVILDKGTLVNSLYNYPLNMTFFSTAEKLEIGDVPFVSINVKATRPEALEYYRRVSDAFKLDLHLYEGVNDLYRSGELFTLKTGKRDYKSRSVIIATGFYDIPNRLGVPGEDLPKVHHYFKESHPYYAKKIVVIGSANSAVDVALESYRKGSQVTMVIRNEGFGHNVKYWVKPDIENRIKEGSIKAYFNSAVTEIKAQSVVIKTPGEIVEVENDFVLAMTGYLPNFDLLKKAGIEFRDDEGHTPIYDPLTMETNAEGVYLAGVVCGGYDTRKWFIENSREHAGLIAADLLRKLGEQPVLLNTRP